MNKGLPKRRNSDRPIVKLTYLIRPAMSAYSSRSRTRLRPGELCRVEKVMQIIPENGIDVEAVSFSHPTIIVKQTEFCVVVRRVLNRDRGPRTLGICLPQNVAGREVLFYSPTINPLTISGKEGNDSGQL